MALSALAVLTPVPVCSADLTVLDPDLAPAKRADVQARMQGPERVFAGFASFAFHPAGPTSASTVHYATAFAASAAICCSIA